MYNYDNYKLPLDKSNKILEERLVTKKIIKNLNNGVMESYDTYESFKKRNKLDIVTRHFGNSLNDLDFKTILNKFQMDNGYDENNMYNMKSNAKQLGLKTSAGALFKEE